MKIGELARVTDTKVETIRHTKRKGSFRFQPERAEITVIGCP